MRLNTSKSKFFTEQIEYLGYWDTMILGYWKILGYWITRQGIQTIRNKFEAIRWMLSLKLRRSKLEKQNQIRQFIGIVNYCRDMWFLRSELLSRFH
jgi:hypothetical protein